MAVGREAQPVGVPHPAHYDAAGPAKEVKLAQARVLPTSANRALRLDLLMTAR